MRRNLPPSGHDLSYVTLTTRVKVTDLAFGHTAPFVPGRKLKPVYPATIRKDLLERDGGK